MGPRLAKSLGYDLIILDVMLSSQNELRRSAPVSGYDFLMADCRLQY
jgi:hypothetical protein